MVNCSDATDQLFVCLFVFFFFFFWFIIRRIALDKTMNKKRNYCILLFKKYKGTLIYKGKSRGYCIGIKAGWISLIR